MTRSKKQVPTPEQIPLQEFPCAVCLPGCEAEKSVKNLTRLLAYDVAYSHYLSGGLAKRLVATALESYRVSQASSRWDDDPFLKKLGTNGKRLAMALSAIFDLATNVEYCSVRLGRLTDDKWIYCNAAQCSAGGTGETTKARVFYSFLKQCPYCCLRIGLGARIEGAQHKPKSHHIGEITGCLMGLLMHPVLGSAEPPLRYAMVTKQSHNVDAVAFSRELAVLLEIKASPLVTLPLAADLEQPLVRSDDGETQEYAQHRLVDWLHSSRPLYLFVPHRDERIELGLPNTPDWPYEPVIAHLSDSDRFLSFLSAWAELFLAFAVPKTERVGRVAAVAYLTNGWGDEIDSNKTKPGLGRTDDLKKGTYQLLKYGAYYKDRCLSKRLYGALLANLDPVNLWAEYLEQILDVRWSKTKYLEEYESVYQIPKQRLYYLFEAIVALNRPVINEPALRDVFDFDRGHNAIVGGRLDATLQEWLVGR